jgi:hypothetical protein
MRSITRCVAGLVLSLAAPAAMAQGRPAPEAKRVTVVEYDSFEKAGGYTMADYLAKWSNPYGTGEMSLGDTRAFAGGKFSIDAAPFRTGADFSVFDHIKYFALSNEAFAVPKNGSITFEVEIDAETPGTVPGKVITGTYGPPGSYPNGAPYAATVLQGQQAGATLHMIDFATGQLFDWFVAGERAFCLVERLPSNVTGSPDHVGREKMYTQIIREIPAGPGPHKVAIKYTRTPQSAFVEYFFDNARVARVDDVGIPLDAQGEDYTGIYPSLGPGELLRGKVNTVSIGHGLFSLLDAFPFQHPEAPELSVSIPIEHRLFGQGARARFDNFKVTTIEAGE